MLLSSDCWPFTRSMGRTNSDDLIQSHYSATIHINGFSPNFLLTLHYELKASFEVEFFYLLQYFKNHLSRLALWEGIY